MSEPAYKGFRQDEMEFQYNPRVSVPEFPELARIRSAQARKVRDSAKSWLNVPYGSSPRELLDIYAADKQGGPVLVYTAATGAAAARKTTAISCRRSPSAAQRSCSSNMISVRKLRLRTSSGKLVPQSPGSTKILSAMAQIPRRSSSPDIPPAAISRLWRSRTTGRKKECRLI